MKKKILSEADPEHFFCYHKIPYGPGPYCTGCGGLIKKKKVKKSKKVESVLDEDDGNHFFS